VLAAGFGWAVVVVARPADRATALAAGLLAGLTAGFAAYVLLGPVLVIQSQLAYERVRVEAEERERLRVYPHPPPREPRLRDFGPTADHVRGAYARVWGGLFQTALPFVGFGLFSAWAADHTRRTRGSGPRGLAVYLELVAGPLMLAVAVSFVGAFLVLTVGSRPADLSQTARLVAWMFGSPLLLAGLAVVGVLRGWRWWWRLLAYLGWLGGTFLYLTVILD
jgi:hypothetical protein